MNNPYNYDEEKKKEWLELSKTSQDMLLELAVLQKEEDLSVMDKARIIFLSEYFDRADVTICCVPNGLLKKAIGV